MQELSRESRATLFMTLLTAFFVMLHRYTGETDLTVGTYVAGRNRPELESVLGFFLNTIALRLRLTPNTSFRRLIAQVKDVALDAYAYQDVPFAQVVEHLQPERDFNKNPFFQIIFQMLNLPPVNKNVKVTDRPQLSVQRGTAVFDVTFTFWESGDVLKGHIEYNADIFDPESITQLISHYKLLLGSLAANPDQSISQLSLISPDERQRAITVWNNTRVIREDFHRFAQLLDLQGAPSDAIAILDGLQQVSFGHLRREVNKLARFLIKRGLGPEVVCGIYLDRSIYAVISMLAVIKAGGAFLLLDPCYPEGRIAFMIHDATPVLIITNSSLTSRLREYSNRIVCLDADAPSISLESDTSLQTVISPRSLAYVVYTSGSTGAPKGIAIEYAQIMNRLAWMWKICPFFPNEICCQKTALNFVDSIWEILGPLLKGVGIVIVRDAVLGDPLELCNVLRANSVTRIWVVPSLLRSLLETVPDLQASLPSLRLWVTTGEILSVDLLTKFRQKMPRGILCNLYGTSEVWDATWYETGEIDTSRAQVSIGFPIDNVRCYVLDDNLEILPPGIVGELYIGGIGVGRGYINEPGLTAERFVPDPFSNDPGARMYKTGDLARWRKDGSVNFIGRVDHQIKLRGYRIELEEVESMLEQYPSVAQAVVVSAEVGDGTRLHAYVVPRGSTIPTAGQLRVFVKDHAPSYMIPATFTIVETIPLLPNGKIDRVSLAIRPSSTSDEFVASYSPPENALEEKIARIWQRVLNSERVGLDDNFFDLGGHSLLLTKIQHELSEELALDIPVMNLFRYTTIRSLAQFVERTLSGCTGERR
jgi:amino acid adenylation domain-containing protein